MKKILLILLVFLGSINLSAQRFGMALQAGPSLAQIDGDFTKGFDKLGLSAGIEGQVYFTKRFYTSLGFQYAIKGSKRKTDSFSPKENFDITLNYVEIPFCMHFRSQKIRESKRSSFYNYDLYAGAAFGRLMNSNLKDGLQTIDNAFPFIEKNEISALIGVRYRISKKIAIGGEFIRSLTRIYDYKKLENAAIRMHWYSRVLSLKMVYNL